MDFHAAMETFAEAWVAANTQTAVNSDAQGSKQTSGDGPPTQLSKPQLPGKLIPIKHTPPVPPQHSPPPSSSSSNTKSLPLHCIIEQTAGPPSFDTTPSEAAIHHTIELDSYAILPGTTLLSECVRAALIKLGYNPSEVLGSKGAIQIKNWKPLSFETITDDKQTTIEDILGDLTQVATLRIRMCSQSKLSSASEVKEKLLQLLLNQSHSLLINAGCPIEKGLLASISTGQTLASISPEVRRAFDRWYNEQLKHVKQEHKLEKDSGNESVSEKSPKCPSSPRDQPTSSPPRPLATSTPTQPHYLPGKTRMRTSFDPEHEIPRLQKWFAENQHPSREQMLHFLGILNLLDSRKGRRPLDLTNIIYWFKNARAAHRRASKCTEDDSFEMEEPTDMPITSIHDGLPFLPNRNAVYMVPYPLHPTLGGQGHCGHSAGQSHGGHSAGQGHGGHSAGQSHGGHSAGQSHGGHSTGQGHGGHSAGQNGHLDNKEPCDLSVYRKSNAILPPKTPPVSPVCDQVGRGSQNVPKPFSNIVKSPREHSEDSCSPERKCDVKNEVEEKKDEELDSVKMEVSSRQEDEKKVEENKDIESNNNINDTDVPMDLKTQLKREIEFDPASDNDVPRDLTNGKREHRSDDEEEEDDFESDYDDDKSINDDNDSLSSHEGKHGNSMDHRGYLSLGHGPPHHLTPMSSSSPSSQPLHIPQFPHPLAMHYFPLNTHLYTQQANSLKFANHHHHHASPQQTSPKTGQENAHRKRRTRVFIDPLSEIPKLEKWFLEDTHPSAYMIDKYCEELNSSEYRQKFPRLESKNVQLWFKNHRAKVKRMRVTQGDSNHLQAFD